MSTAKAFGFCTSTDPAGPGVRAPRVSWKLPGSASAGGRQEVGVYVCGGGSGDRGLVLGGWVGWEGGRRDCEQRAGWVDVVPSTQHKKVQVQAHPRTEVPDWAHP